MHTTPTPSPVSRRAQLHADQSGYTLIEVIIAVALAGMVILSLAAGFLTIVRTNALNSDRQRVDAAMTSYSESVRGGEYLPCQPGITPDYDAQYAASPGAWQPPAGIGVDVARVEYWDAGQQRYVANCPGTDGGAQRLTLQTTWRDLERSAQIVKRR